MADLVTALVAVVVFVVPGLWLLVSGVTSIRAARRADGMDPTPVGDASPGVATVTGEASPLFPDDALPAPLSPGLALVYTYRVVSLPDPNAALDAGETVARGTAAVPFVVGSAAESVLVQPTGAEVHLEDGEEERFEGDPPERIADFLAFQEIDLAAEASEPGTATAVVVRTLYPGEEVYVTGRVERIAEGTAEGFPGEFAIQSGTDRTPLVVADHPGAGSAVGQTGRGVVKVVVGLAMLVPGILFAALYGIG